MTSRKSQLTSGNGQDVVYEEHFELLDGIKECLEDFDDIDLGSIKTQPVKVISDDLNKGQKRSTFTIGQTMIHNDKPFRLLYDPTKVDYSFKPKKEVVVTEEMGYFPVFTSNPRKPQHHIDDADLEHVARKIRGHPKRLLAKIFGTSLLAPYDPSIESENHRQDCPCWYCEAHVPLRHFERSPIRFDPSRYQMLIQPVSLTELADDVWLDTYDMHPAKSELLSDLPRVYSATKEHEFEFIRLPGSHREVFRTKHLKFSSHKGVKLSPYMQLLLTGVRLIRHHD